MCGRYGLYDISDDITLKENTGYEFKPNYNAAPTQKMPVIIEQDDARAATIMQWGIPRKLGKDVEKNLFNTRSEKAFDRFWGKSARSHRCLVPANGFYEWKKSDKGKIPYWIHPIQSSLMYFAGIFDEDHEGKLHYSIMTTNPNHEMSDIHDRMPVILNDEARATWLDIHTDEGLLGEVLKPSPDNSLDTFEVSTNVNYVRNNSGELITPVNSK